MLGLASRTCRCILRDGAGPAGVLSGASARPCPAVKRKVAVALLEMLVASVAAAGPGGKLAAAAAGAGGSDAAWSACTSGLCGNGRAASGWDPAPESAVSECSCT